MKRPDLSNCPPPSIEFMATMQVYREAVAEFGRTSREACIAIAMALEYAPRALSEWIAADARARGLLPDPSGHAADGQAVYTAQDLADFYGVHVSEVVMRTGPGEPMAMGHGPN